MIALKRDFKGEINMQLDFYTLLPFPFLKPNFKRFSTLNHLSDEKNHYSGKFADYCIFM